MKFPRSIKTRLLIWQMLVLAAVLISLLELHHHIRQKELISSLDTTLQNIQLGVMPIIAPAPNLARSRASSRGNNNRKHMELPPHDRMPSHGRFDSPRDGRSEPPMHGHMQDQRRDESNNSEREEQTPAPKMRARKILDSITGNNTYIITWECSSGEERERYGTVPKSLSFEPYSSQSPGQKIYTRDGYREIVTHNQGHVLVVIGQPLKELHSLIKRDRQNMTLGGIIVLIIAWFSGRLILDRGLKPITTISRTANEIAEGSRDKRIQLSDAPEEMEGMAITLNKTFDSLDDAIKRQARFTADASHELRTPISVIMAQTQATLRKERTPEQYISTLNACLRAAKRMKNLSESLLDLTRIDAQDLALDKRECKLGSIISEAVELTDDISSKHEVKYVENPNPVSVSVDKDRIHQLVINLIGNAIKYNPDGCRIEVSLQKKENSAIIKVSDNGVGIPPEHLPHIFDRFYRIDKSRSREKGGSGLGLSIVQNIVNAHDGTIKAESEQNTFTSFTISLPC